MNTAIYAPNTVRKLIANLLRRERKARAALRLLEAGKAPETVLAEARGACFEAHNAAQASIQLANGALVDGFAQSGA